MKKLISAAILATGAMANYTEVCVGGINLLNSTKTVDVCLYIPEGRVDEKTKQGMIKTYSELTAFNAYTWEAKEKALEGMMAVVGLRDVHYSKFTINENCSKQ